jgi:hypothetical protein
MVVLFHVTLFIAVIAAHIYAYMFIYHAKVLYRLIDVAFSNERKFIWPHKIPFKFHPMRLWRALFVILSMIGIGTILYSGFLQALAWIPYEWSTWDGVWIAEYIAGALSLLSFLFLIFVGGPKLTEQRGVDG